MRIFLSIFLTCGLMFFNVSYAQDAKVQKNIDNSLVKIRSFDGINNVIKYKNFYIASQPSPDAITMLKEKGISAVITLRAKQENNGFEEQKAVEAAGLKFYRTRIYNDRYGPINDGKINLNELTKALYIIANTTDGDVFIHCGSGDRASIVLATYLFSMDKNSAKETLSKARIAGLKHPGITEQLEIYMGVEK